MCDPFPGLALLRFSVAGSWSDEELVRFLGERKAEDSLPGNVLVGVDLSLFRPQESSGQIWYLNFPDDQQNYDNSENAIRKTIHGYWKSIEVLNIPTSTTIVGVKTILEFYEREAPSGEKTGFVMHEYQIEQNDGANAQQDYKSLSTVFVREDKKINAEDQQVSRSTNAPNYRSETSYLQYLAELDEQSAAVKSEVVPSSQQNISSSRGQEESKIYTPADGIVFSDALANNDYIELNDLLRSETSSSTSEYSSRPAEENADLDAFLREILDDNTNYKDHNEDSKSSISAPSKLDHVVITPSEQEIVNEHDNDVVVAQFLLESAVPDGERDQHSNEECLQHSPTSSCSLNSLVKQSCSDNSNSS